MTFLEHPESIRHFQSLCDACQALKSSYHNQSEIKLYADGYLHALRKSARLDQKEQEKLERVIERWILDPSSFIGPEGNISTLFQQGT